MITDEALEKESEIVHPRNQAEDLQDEVARLPEWKKPELRTNSVAIVNILASPFKFREERIGKSRIHPIWASKLLNLFPAISSH
jgi:hypothetical protein